MLVVEVICEQHQHLGRADVNVAIHQIIPQLTLRVVLDQCNIQLYLLLLGIIRIQKQLVCISISGHNQVVI